MATRRSLSSRKRRTAALRMAARRRARSASVACGVATMAPARRTPSLRKTAMRASGAGVATEKAPSSMSAGRAATIQPPSCCLWAG